MSCLIRLFRNHQLWMYLGQEFYSSLISAEYCLSQSNKENCIKILQTMKPINVQAKGSSKRAGVLVPLCKVENEISLLYTVRALHLKLNGGEVSFPGGKYDDADRSILGTALRETFEEIGIPEKSVDIWGSGPDIYRPDIVVTPILGYIGNIDVKRLQTNPQEVSKVFIATLNDLCNPSNFKTTQFRIGKTHVGKTPVYLGAEKRIWGLTAIITHVILSALIPSVYNENIKFKSSIHKILSSK